MLNAGFVDILIKGKKRIQDHGRYQILREG
jgi:hypothetical protein